MRVEIEKHWNKLLLASKLTETELRESQYRLHKKISFISEELISKETWFFVERMVGNIDIDDIDFIAINEYLKGILWTGDKVLYNGLKKKGYDTVANTTEMILLRNAQQKQRNIK